MNITQAINNLGGHAAVAKRYNVTSQAVSNWKRFGKFPDYLHYKIYRDTLAAGWEMPPEVFELGKK